MYYTCSQSCFIAISPYQLVPFSPAISPLTSVCIGCGSSFLAPVSPFGLFSLIAIFLVFVLLLPLLCFLLLLLGFLFVLDLLLFGGIFVGLLFVCGVCFHLLFLNISLFLIMLPFLPFLLFITFFSLFLSFIFYSNPYVIFGGIPLGSQMFLLFLMFMLLVENGSLHLSFALILLLGLFLDRVLLCFQVLVTDLLLLLAPELFSSVGCQVCLIFNLIFLDPLCNADARDFSFFLLVIFFLLHLFIGVLSL